MSLYGDGGDRNSSVASLTLGEGSRQFHMIWTALSSSSRIFSFSFGLKK